MAPRAEVRLSLQEIPRRALGAGASIAGAAGQDAERFMLVAGVRLAFSAAINMATWQGGRETVPADPPS